MINVNPYTCPVISGGVSSLAVLRDNSRLRVVARSIRRHMCLGLATVEQRRAPVISIPGMSEHQKASIDQSLPKDWHLYLLGIVMGSYCVGTRLRFDRHPR